MKIGKKLSLDQCAREAGYKFIRDIGPRPNNRNQFMEWADEQAWRLERRKSTESPQQLLQRQTEGQDIGVLAVHSEVLRALVPS